LYVLRRSVTEEINGACHMAGILVLARNLAEKLENPHAQSVGPRRHKFD